VVCIVGALGLLMAFAQPLSLPASDNIMLSLSRVYGRYLFRQCRLDIVVYESRGTANLWCDVRPSLDGKGRPDLNARQELPSDEAKRLTATVRGARLFEGGHVGVDGTGSDDIFETLKVQSQDGGGTVVLVTSGNPTFDREGARKQLLSMLKDIEARLRQKAGR
jgi:hypothetical protein